MRFRVTALPLLLETTNPRRGGPDLPGDLTTTSPPSRWRFPSERTLRNSLSPRRVCTSGGETLAALLSASLDRGATGSGAHPVAKPMPALATTNLRLVSPFHNEVPGESGVEKTGYEPSETYVKAQKAFPRLLRCRSRRKPIDREKKIRARRSIARRNSPTHNLEKRVVTWSFLVES